MQRTWVLSLEQEDSTCLEDTKTKYRNYSALCYSCKKLYTRAPKPQSEAPGTLESMLCNKRSHYIGKPKHSN